MASLQAALGLLLGVSLLLMGIFGLHALATAPGDMNVFVAILICAVMLMSGSAITAAALFGRKT